jgi:hypothetical protein
MTIQTTPLSSLFRRLMGSILSLISIMVNVSKAFSPATAQRRNESRKFKILPLRRCAPAGEILI